MLVLYILFKIHIEVYKPPVPQVGKQHKHHFEGKTQVVDKRVPHKINERGPCIIRTEPGGVILLRSQKIVLRIGPGEHLKYIVNDAKKRMEPVQVFHHTNLKPGQALFHYLQQRDRCYIKQDHQKYSTYHSSWFLLINQII